MPRKTTKPLHRNEGAPCNPTFNQFSAADKRSYLKEFSRETRRRGLQLKACNKITILDLPSGRISCDYDGKAWFAEFGVGGRFKRGALSCPSPDCPGKINSNVERPSEIQVAPQVALPTVIELEFNGEAGQ